jgi:hypothetical protein
MSVQVNKTYRGLNPELIYDQVRDLLARRGLETVQSSIQTYSVSSGATQSRVTSPVRTGNGKDCGNLQILGAPNGDVRMTLELDDTIVSSEAIKAAQSDIDFMLGPNEVQW